MADQQQQNGAGSLPLLQQSTPSSTSQPRTAANPGGGRRQQQQPGPRSISIQRSSGGFGFTLRHFIVYPPDAVSDCPEEWERGMSAGLLDPMMPMDTIFVKHVRENGPAVKAGLSTGDQVVSVNGESVICKSYAQVVQMIQKSGPVLHMVVMPKEQDVLQQCFADTAHNPHTNARPLGGSSPALAAAAAAAAVASSTSMSRTTTDQLNKAQQQDTSKSGNNIMSHLPRPKPYQPFQVETKKVGMSPSSGSDGCPSPVTMMLPRQSSVGSSLASTNLGGGGGSGSRVFSPLTSAATSAAAPPLGVVGRASSQPVPAVLPSDDSAAAARLAAAAALVSKSVRKSADFNPPAMDSAAGNRTSFADPGSFTSPNFQHHQVQLQQQTNKRSSFAGTPTSRTEFILNTPSNTPSASGWSQHPLLLEGGPYSLPYQQQQHHGMDSLTSSRGSLYSVDADGPMTTRIRKSFEQKEEFLKRPALPYWVSVQEAQQSPPVTKEFYAQPQKFARPVWPPAAAVIAGCASASTLPPSTTSTTSSFESLQDTSGSGHRQTATVVPVVTAIEPWSMVFTSNRGTPPPALGLVPNTVPKPFYGSAATSSSGSPSATGQANSPSGNRMFVTTLTRIQENITDPTAATVDPQQQKRLDLPDLKSRSAAPLASPEEFFTPSPTKAAQHPLAAAVIRRAKQIENGHQPPAAQPQPSSTSTGRPVNALSPAEKSLLQRIAQRSHIGRPVGDVSAANVPLLRAGQPARIELELQRPGGSGNRTVLIGSSKLHCEPPPVSQSAAAAVIAAAERAKPPLSDIVMLNGLRSETDMAAEEAERQKNLVLRQHSYRTAVRAVSHPTAEPNSSNPNSGDGNKVDENSNTARHDHLQQHQQRPNQLPLLTSSRDRPNNINHNNCLLLQTDIDEAMASSPSPRSTLNRSPATASTTTIISDFELSVLERFDQLLATLGTRSSSGGSSSSVASSAAGQLDQSPSSMSTTTATTNAITANVHRRQKIYDDDSDRGMRRVSYLKATSNNPMESGAATTPETASPVTEPTKGTERRTVDTSTPVRPTQPIPPATHSIQKLRSLFGDKVTTSSPPPAKETGQQQPPSPSTPLCREGWLNVKQTIVDCRRSTDRSWRQLWTRLRGGQVHFMNQQTASDGMPEASTMSVDLRGCTVEPATSYTKRKHVLRLATANGLCEYLIQCEDGQDLTHWLEAFQQEQQSAASEEQQDCSMASYSSSEMMLVRQAQEMDNNAQRRMGRFMQRNRSPTGHSPVSKTRKPSLPGSSGDNTPTSTISGPSNNTSPASGAGVGNSGNNNNTKPATWRHKVVQQFKKIQAGSHQQQTSSSSGTNGGHGNNSNNWSAAEGATLGVPLQYCPRSSLSDSIPLIVELCVGIVEARGLESVGVYRVPGNSVAVNALSDSLNRGFSALDRTDRRWNDVNVISSLIKSFFRRLPEPLVTAELYGPLIEASKSESDGTTRLAAIKRLLDQLPEPHYSTLRYLVGHLARVAAKSSLNKMEARNLAIVFGPTLIRPADDSTVTMVTDMSHQCRIVETLIDKVDFFFPSAIAEVASTATASSTPATTEPISSDKQIVASIIAAARRKRQTSLDSPDLSDRSAAASIATTNAQTPPTGSAHSLVELGSTGDQPALPVQASEFRCTESTTAVLERKRSASLGGETALAPPTTSLPVELQLADASETDSILPEQRSRTSSGSFVHKQQHPIDAAGIRSYCGLSAVTQERIRLFEQETKALMQRDLAARQRRETTTTNTAMSVTGESSPPSATVAGNLSTRRPDKVEVEWQKAKVDVEMDEFVDAVSDNPSNSVSSQPDQSTDATDGSATKPVVIEQPMIANDSAPVPEVQLEDESTKLVDTVVAEKKVEVVEQEKKEVVVAPVVVPVETPVEPTTKVTKSNSRVSSTNKPVGMSRQTGSAVRSQGPKGTETMSTATSSPSRTASGSARSNLPARASSAPSPSTKSARSSVVNRARTVDLGKVAGRKLSDHQPPPPRTVVRQMSTGGLLQSSPAFSPSSRPSTRLTNNGKLSLRMKVESPKRNPVQASQIKDTKPSVEESKKLSPATANTNDTEQCLLESNLDETLSTVQVVTDLNGPQKDNRSEELDMTHPDKLVVGMKRPVVPEVFSKGVAVKRSDSLTKDEKTESNTKTRLMGSNGGERRTTRKFTQRQSGESALKRRHTVGGTRDFDKVRIRWLNPASAAIPSTAAPRWSAWDRLQPLISDEDLNVERSLRTWMRSERMRTSSPELCRRSELPTAAAATPTTESAAAGHELLPPLADSPPLPSAAAVVLS